MDGLQIKQVADMTGLTEQRIRKWEERYHAVSPVRLDNGYRLYSFADVERLKQIKILVERGVPVSRAVKAVREVAGRLSVGEPAHEPTLLRGHDEDMVEQLLGAGLKSDVQYLDTLLRQAYAMFGLQPFVQRVLLPFLRAVGERWETKQWTEYQEHLASLTVRNFLIHCMANLPAPAARSPILLTSCILGERHDIMLHIIMLQAKQLGWSTLFLGADPAPGAVARSIDTLHPKMVLLSISTLLPLQNQMDAHVELRSINQLAGDSATTSFHIGGPPAILATLRTDYPYIRPVATFAECIAALARG